MVFRIEWWTGKEWHQVGYVYRSLGHRAHEHPVDAFARQAGEPVQPLTKRLRALPHTEGRRQARYRVKIRREVVTA